MPVGRLMQRLSSQYARRVHRRQGNGGHLFQQRYHSLLIDPDAWLLKLIRYLHLIPVRSGAVRDPNDLRFEQPAGLPRHDRDSVAHYQCGTADVGSAS